MGRGKGYRLQRLIILYTLCSVFFFLFLYPTFYLLYWDLKGKFYFLFNNYHCNFYSVKQSSTIKPTLLLLLILVQYDCTVCIVYNVSNPQQVDKSLEEPQHNGKQTGGPLDQWNCV